MVDGGKKKDEKEKEKEKHKIPGLWDRKYNLFCIPISKWTKFHTCYSPTVKLKNTSLHQVVNLLGPTQSNVVWLY